MRRFMSVGGVALAVVVAIGVGGPLRPVEAQAPAEVIPLHVSGVAASEATDAGHVAYTVEVLSIVTGERLGTLHDELTCSTTAPPPCLVFDVVTTLRLADGEIVNHAQWSGVPDPQRPGFLLVGTRSDAPTARGTAGAYAGRAVRWAGSGTVDTRSFPSRFGYDIFSIVTIERS